jgi:hypothetical protein
MGTKFKEVILYTPEASAIADEFFARAKLAEQPIA